MQINYSNILNTDKALGKATVYIAFVSISNYQQEASQLINKISENSWLNELDEIARLSFQTKVQNTAEKMIQIFKNAQSPSQTQIESDFGEYLISLKSEEYLEQEQKHKQIPLSELWKEKVSGNGGFDFHTESPSSYITFGEAKYRSGKYARAYKDASDQIVQFISPAQRKDFGDILLLQNLNVSQACIDNLKDGRRNFAAGFSLQSTDYELIEKKIMNEPSVQNLIQVAEELYIIGFEIC